MRGMLVCALMAVCVAAGQEFEVVSVKPNKSGTNSSHSNSDRGMLTSENLTLRSLIVMAYGIKDYQLEGPNWLASDRYDVAARFPEALPEDREKYRAAFGAMMQKMLADRFKLAVHRDQKTFPVYGLVVGKKGIKCEAVTCKGSNSNSSNTHYQSTCTTMKDFAAWLSRPMDNPVLDMTGLTASYKVTLDWVPEPRSGEGKNASADPPTGPTLTEALQDQLGLKLEPRKAPIEIIVVDHAERVPTEN
jgi:uncharacterized protein (TIGR03435 family)